jgi:gamma-glutamyltranspeptidase / glutathione hydrolase
LLHSASIITIMYLLGSLLVSSLLTKLSAASPSSPPGYHPHKPHHPAAGQGKLGAVSSESSICSNIGTEVLKDGGNAADSLVATVFCVGVIGMVRDH